MHCMECGARKATATARFCAECGVALGISQQVAPRGFTAMPAHGPPATPLEFDATRPPQPGQAVPIDSVWAEHPYPGPPPAKLRGSAPQKLVQLGALRGRPLQEIQAILGAASSSSSAGDGMTLLQWQKITAYSGSYHYAMIFDRYGVCAGLTHEHVG